MGSPKFYDNGTLIMRPNWFQIVWICIDPKHPLLDVMASCMHKQQQRLTALEHGNLGYQHLHKRRRRDWYPKRRTCMYM